MTTLKDGSRIDDKPSGVELRALDDEIRDLEFEHNPAKQGATACDLRDMDALGIMPTFRRRFKFLAMVGLLENTGRQCLTSSRWDLQVRWWPLGKAY